MALLLRIVKSPRTYLRKIANEMPILWKILAGVDDIKKYYSFDRASRTGASTDELISLKIKALGNEEVFIRKNSRIDRSVLRYVFFDQYHLPVHDLPAEAVIIDLGTNIGLTVRHLKHLHPRSRVYGYEMEDRNFVIAEQNCRNLGNCTLVKKAVWSSTKTVTYKSDVDTDAFKVDAVVHDRDTSPAFRQVAAISMRDLVEAHSIENIDYLKMDIEGAEVCVFRSSDLDWLSKVGMMNIELHDTPGTTADEFADELIALLEARNFNAWRDTHHWSTVIAERSDLQR